MQYDLAAATELLTRTPIVLNAMLSGLSREWVHSNYGEGTWSPFDIVGHLIHGEKTDWIPRAKIILEQGESETFEPFDRYAQIEANWDRSIGELLDEFGALRGRNLETLGSLQLDEEKLAKTGVHPDFGQVTLKQLLATWVAHDLHHIAQIAKAMARQYGDEVGPWREYLGILTR